jgi:hypothetical protein
LITWDVGVDSTIIRGHQHASVRVEADLPPANASTTELATPVADTAQTES